MIQYEGGLSIVARSRDEIGIARGADAEFASDWILESQYGNNWHRVMEE